MDNFYDFGLQNGQFGPGIIQDTKSPLQQITQEQFNKLITDFYPEPPPGRTAPTVATAAVPSPSSKKVQDIFTGMTSSASTATATMKDKTTKQTTTT
jgi:hypothetical protein